MAIRFAQKYERNPGWEELLSFGGKDTGAAGLKALRSAYAQSVTDIQKRWDRANRDLAKFKNEKDLAGTARTLKRMDRIGEEALTLWKGLAGQIADRHQSPRRPGEPIPLTAAAHLLWEAILSWNDEAGTLTNHTKRKAKARWARRTPSEVDLIPKDEELVTAWAHIRTRLSQYKQ
jgi:hypothetical protein